MIRFCYVISPLQRISWRKAYWNGSSTEIRAAIFFYKISTNFYMVTSAVMDAYIVSFSVNAPGIKILIIMLWKYLYRVPCMVAKSAKRMVLCQTTRFKCKLICWDLIRYEVHQQAKGNKGEFIWDYYASESSLIHDITDFVWLPWVIGAQAAVHTKYN